MNGTLLPVTVLSGFLGAGKTTLLNHLLRHSGGRRIAILVNDMSEVNIDADLVRRQTHVERTEARLVELSNGCICCTLREDLLIEVRRMAEEGAFDYLLIESTGISEPVPVAQTFFFEDEEGRSLAQLCRLDTMVTVVDGPSILQDLASDDNLADRGEALGEDDDRSLADLLIDQLEFADVVVINKLDRLTVEEAQAVEGLVRKLNPGAEILVTEHGQVAPEAVMGTGRFHFETAQQSAGWQRELAGEHVPETETYGFTSFVFQERRPFHPGRLWSFLQMEWPGVVRSKGFFWVASDPDLALSWALAGGSRHFEVAGWWWSGMTPERREEMGAPETPDEPLDPLYGDRMQQLVFIGRGMDEAALREALSLCLLTDAEGASDPARWCMDRDGFPLQRPDEEHGDDEEDGDAQA